MSPINPGPNGKSWTRDDVVDCDPGTNDFSTR